MIRQFSFILDSDSSCCFRYGLIIGSGGVPCCLKEIKCDEYPKLLKDLEEKGPLVLQLVKLNGQRFNATRVIGKHQSCPNDVVHAHQLVLGK